MKIALFALMVYRSMDTHLSVTVPRYEADLLAAVHGSEGVELLSQEPVGFFEVGAVYEERDRLRFKYGMKNADTSWVDAVYPNDTALIAAVKAGMADEEPSEKALIVPVSRDEMKAVLDGLGVEYKGNASTETLAALVAEHAPAV